MPLRRSAVAASASTSASGEDSGRLRSGSTSGQRAAGGGPGGGRGGLPIVLLVEVERVLERPRAEVGEEDHPASLRVDPTELGLIRVGVRDGVGAGGGVRVSLGSGVVDPTELCLGVLEGGAPLAQLGQLACELF